ncbi:conserved hypothetical protein [Microsporum canis CBS 113480]|uniref:Elongation of fatty acids protein n=1 Tax=Arthroderma otae (strain ATCC MYA-4605 / CBS 113480) TaxID=554155 RepID=C5G185_ARTOC|nr:conserved hypothetical protein [Microsporum canis CBS 113480]EEQ28548.1 conserved hypothetical protein [Microsporum canis CBS 113480]
MALHLGLPPSALFSFPPDPRPAVLPPAAEPLSWHRPFNVPPALYSRLLDARVPLAIAGSYALVVCLLNRLNRNSGYRPWSISKTRPFKAFVVLHNVFLALYSLWTFLGMVRAFRLSWPDPSVASASASAAGSVGGSQLAAVTYHHAGAMMCMWAGIRYMASPIWIFALFNSLIHAMMYTYYTLTALRVRVPVRIKRSLTTMQIVQFVVGTLLAAAHLFVSYSVPVPVARPLALRPLTQSIPSGSESGTGIGPWLKKLAFRAAGADGVASNVLSANGTLFGRDGADAAHAVVNHRELRYSLESATVPCINTSGQAFAIWLNLVYLLPLTFLFVRFFVRSYLRRTTDQRGHHHVSEKAGLAIKDVTREITNAVIEMHGDVVSDLSSGTSTPRPEAAYEANVLDLLNRKQRHAEQSISSSRPLNTSAAAPTSTTDEQKYEASVKDVMSAREKEIDRHPEQSTAIHVENSPTPVHRRKKAHRRH